MIDDKGQKYIGDKLAYEKEVIQIRDFEKKKGDYGEENFHAFLSEQSKEKGTFLGASSTSIVTKCILQKQLSKTRINNNNNNNSKTYELKLSVEKRIPLIRHHNLKKLMESDKKYELLFVQDEEEEEQNSELVGIQRYYKIFNHSKEYQPVKSIKPFQSILSKYNPNMISLNLFLKKSRLKYLPKQLLTIVKSVAESLTYLHSNDLCHGNVCLNNILILENQDQSISKSDIILCDPGMHYFFMAPTAPNPDLENTLLKMTDGGKINEYQPVIRSGFNFLAPEMIEQMNNNKFEPTNKSDIFQLGICMLCISDIYLINSIIQMLKSQSTAINSTLLNVINKINFSIKESESIKQLLRKMLCTNPSERFSSEEVVKESEAILSSLETSQEMTELEKQKITNGILIQDNNEFLGQFEEIFATKKLEAIRNLKDITTEDNPQFSADHLTHTDLIRLQTEIVNRFNLNTLDFSKKVLSNQCERIPDQQLKQNLLFQISENKYRAISFNQVEQVMILIENDQLTRVNLFYYATQFERESTQKQLGSKESKQNLNDFKFEDPCSVKQIIMSCIFIDEEHFLTVDSSLKLKLWNVNLKNKSVEKTEALKGFQTSSISLININRQFCAVHDKNQVHVYELVDIKYDGGSYKYLGEKKELYFPDYSIKKILAIPEYDEGLFLILTEQSQLIFCRTKNQSIVWEYSLLNIPQIAIFFDNPVVLDPREIPIPTSDIFIDDSSIVPIISSNHKDSSSYQTHSSLMSQQQIQSSNNMCSRISRILGLVRPQQISVNSRSSSRLSRLSGHMNEFQDEEVRLNFNTQIGIIMDSSFFFTINLNDLVRKQFKNIKYHCELPQKGKYVSGMFHPKNKDVFIYITDSYELIYFDFINESIKNSWYNSVNFLNLHIIPFQKQYYIFLTGAFKNNMFARIETDPLTGEDKLQLKMIRESHISKAIIFPKALYPLQRMFAS